MGRFRPSNSGESSYPNRSSPTWRSAVPVLALSLADVAQLVFLRHTSCWYFLVHTVRENEPTLGVVRRPGGGLNELLGRNMTMEAKSISSKSDDGAGKDNGLAAKASARITEVADKASDMAADAQTKVEEKAKNGGYRLQEAAQKAGHVAKEIATKAIHSARQTAQKVFHRAEQITKTVEHRRQELADKTAGKLK